MQTILFIKISDLNGVYTIWLRDVKRFLRDKPRIIGATAQPALFLLILGTGVGSSMKEVTLESGRVLNGIEGYLPYIFPGILGMSLLFTSIFSAISIIWDREIGFLKVVMVVPVSRWAISLGKTLGGSTVATMQATVMLMLGPLVGVSISPVMVVKLVPLFFLISISLTAMGISVASRMRSMQGFTSIMNFLVLPMFFLSGAMFPVESIPLWMVPLVDMNPLTYGVDALRFIVIDYSKHSLIKDVMVVGVFGMFMLALSTYMFGRAE